MSAAVAAVAIILAFSGLASAAAPNFRDPEPDRLVYDTAEAFPNEARRATNQVLRDLEARTGARVVVYTLVDPGSASDPATADADSALLLTEWGLGGRDSVALVWAFDRGRESATIGIAVSETLAATGLDHGSLRSIVDDATADDLAAGRWLAALTRATVAVSVALPSNASTPAPGVSPGPAPTPTPGVFPGTGSPPSAGPPYPDPVSGRVVYDFAEIFTAGTEEQATAMIVAIEERTGAEVVVYSQVKPESDTVAGRARCHRADGSVGRRPEGHRRWAGHPLRHGRQPLPWPGAALRRSRIPRRVPEQRGATADIRRGHAAAAPLL